MAEEAERVQGRLWRRPEQELSVEEGPEQRLTGFGGGVQVWPCAFWTGVSLWEDVELRKSYWPAGCSGQDCANTGG